MPAEMGAIPDNVRSSPDDSGTASRTVDALSDPLGPAAGISLKIRACVLIVASEAIQAGLINESLSLIQRPLTTCAAKSAEEAMSKLGKVRFDCVLVDESVQEIDVLDLIRRIRADHPHLPVILLITTEDFSLRNQALRCGASHCVVKKDFPDDVVSLLVDRALAESSLIRDYERVKKELVQRMQQVEQKAEAASDLNQQLLELQNELYFQTQELRKQRCLADATEGIARAVLHNRNAQERLETTLHQVLRLVEVDFGLLFIRRDGRYQLTAASGYSKKAKDRLHEMNEDEASSLRECRVVREHPRETDGELFDVEREEGIHSRLTCPLLVDGEAVGLLVLASRKYESFSRDERQMVEACGHHIAAALHTDLLKREESPRELSLGALFDECPLSIFLIDTEGKIVDVNGWHLRNASGKGKEDYAKETIFDLVLSDDPELLQSLTDLLHGTPFQRRDLCLQNPDGSRVPARCLYGIPVVDSEGNSRGAILLGDCGGLESGSERYTVAPRYSSEDLEEFLYAASHDMKAPVGSICGFAEALREHFGERLESDGKHWLTRITENAQKLSLLINDLLALYRMEKNPQTMESCDMGRLVGEAVEALEFEIHETRSRVILPAKMPRIACLPNLIFRLWSNILSNCLRYRHPDRRLEIEVGYQEDGERYVFWVKDNGRGIPEGQPERAFALFERLERKGSGTGIGLAIARRIVIGHGGNIWLESKAGKGTTVCFTLPHPQNSGEASNVEIPSRLRRDTETGPLVECSDIPRRES
jgi:nitrogen-specific signal transduction histidine kinase/DNA-binding NarL/FixJ family response regulator